MSVGRILSYLIVSVVFSVPEASKANAQSTACRGPDAYTSYHVGHLKQVARNTNAKAAAWRNNVHLPADTTISVASDSATCASALTAYNADAELGGESASFVYVLKMGSVFIVSNPTYKSGEFDSHFVYSDQFQLLATYLK